MKPIFIQLTTADSKTPFWVNIQSIAAFYRNTDFTMVHYITGTGGSCWGVTETPAEIEAKVDRAWKEQNN